MKRTTHSTVARAAVALGAAAGLALTAGVGSAQAVTYMGRLATPTAVNGPQAAPVAADGTVVAADGSEVGQVATHKRSDGTKPPAELGNPSEWGVVKIEMDTSAGSVRPDSEACVPASGGKWCYGWYTTTSGKYCYSNYLHGTKWHSSSVKIAHSSLSSGAVKPGSASNAHITAGLVFTCYSYYDIL
ncbi:hypothetical protein J2Z21_008258 [Streptomyces griseochromogenes]|uniref:Lactococcin 972 family bacteriocin n=1 Tax=Streptomyces griseochromogenes TaxID=68214 RepID=A0A1B1B0L7_9ACTN|nr:lactococcin 972 family bacteriocin [Streptomyces griseochromogenes]ANP52357.1 hypothetical protein AVL59_24940 [Streptomyces griseochromogenes]MBP2055244.1 hypothetical protein [Streptomyces griseochromogenes]